MKRLLVIIILTLSFQTLTKADDIRDFQIEGMSIGNSALDYFSEEEIKNNLVTYYKDNKISTVQMESSKFITFDSVNFSYQTQDKNYKIIHISGRLYEGSYENCGNKMNEIIKELKKVFKNYQDEKKVEKHDIDKSGKSTVTSFYFYFSSGDLAAVQCYEFSNEVNYADGLKVQLAKDIYVSWISNEAYN